MVNPLKLLKITVIVLLLGTLTPCFAALQPGTVAPDFTLQDLHQRDQSLSTYFGRPIVLFFFCGCRLCHATARAWAANVRRNPQTSRKAKVIIVFSGDVAEAKAFEAQTGISESTSLLLTDPTANVSTMIYDADPCPCAFVITPDQKIIYTNDISKGSEKPIVADRLVARVNQLVATIPASAKAILAASAASDSPDVQVHLDPQSDGGTVVSVEQGFTEAKYNFGTIDRTKSKSVEHVFELKNDTQSDVAITGTQPSCGCTSAFINGVQSFPVDIKPGQTVQATVYVDLTDLYAGDVEKSVYIFGKNGADALTYLEMDGQIQVGT